MATFQGSKIPDDSPRIDGSGWSSGFPPGRNWSLRLEKSIACWLATSYFLLFISPLYITDYYVVVRARKLALLVVYSPHYPKLHKISLMTSKRSMQPQGSTRNRPPLRVCKVKKMRAKLSDDPPGLLNLCLYVLSKPFPSNSYTTALGRLSTQATYDDQPMPTIVYAVIVHNRRRCTGSLAEELQRC